MIKQLDLYKQGGLGKEKKNTSPPQIKRTVKGTCYCYTCMIKSHEADAFGR